MKVKANTKAQVATPSTPKKAKTAAAPAEVSKTWKAESSAAGSRRKLSTMATDAAVSVIANHQGPPKEAARHPALARFGEHLGLGLGVIVTEALALVPKWNKPVVDAQGKQVTSIPGAERVGDHAILARHQEVVGPKVTALVAKMPVGAVRDLLAGLGRGATQAPGTSYRLEAALSDMFKR
jgi:hypothetical protein